MLLLAACLALAAMSSSLLAQAYAPTFAYDDTSAPDVFNDQDVTGVVRLGKEDGLFGPFYDTNYFGPYFHLQHLGGDGPGYEDDGFTSLGLFVPKQFLGGVAFSENYLAVDHLGNVLGSAGAGYRLFDEEWNRTFGTSFWYDGDGGHRGTFNQLGLSVETRGEHWDLFANLYMPIGDDEKRFKRRTAPTGQRIPTFRGQNLIVNAPIAIVEEFELAMKGLDVEFGGPLPVIGKWGVRGYGGWYHFENDNVTDVNGGRFRVTADLTDSLTGQFVLNADNLFSTTVMLGITWTLPGSGANRGPSHMPPGLIRSHAQIRGQSPDDDRGEGRSFASGRPFSESQWYRMFQPVRRSRRVVVTTASLVSFEDVFEVATDPLTGHPLVFLHLDSSAAPGGDGSVERPFSTPQQAEARTTGGEIILVHADSVFNNPANNFISLKPNQRLLGQGPGIQRMIATTQFGTIPIPQGNPDGTMLPRFDGAPMDAITLASGVEVSGLTIANSGAAGILANNLTGEAANVNQVTITGGQIGVNVQGGDGTVNFDETTITGTTGTAFNVGGMSMAQVNYGGDINNTSGLAVNIDGLQAAGNVSFTGGTITDNGGLGIRIRGSAGDATFADVDITNFVSPGPAQPAAVFLGGPMMADANTGTYRFLDLDIMTQNGGGLRAQNSGTVVVDDGNITAMNGRAIFINPTTINLQFGNVTSTGGVTGIELIEAAGSLSISGTTTISGTTGGTVVDGAGIKIQNSTAIVDLANIDIDNTMGAGIALDGVNNTGTLIVRGGDIDTAGQAGTASFHVGGGSPVVTYSANITHTTAGQRIVEILDTTGGSVTFDTGTLTAQTGTGILLQNADSNVSFLGTALLDGATNNTPTGVDIVMGADGNFLFGDNFTITSPTDTAFNLNNSTPTVNFTGTITQAQAGQRAVDLNMLNAGGTANFGGTVTALGMSTGVIIQNSAGDATFENYVAGDRMTNARLQNRALELNENTGTYQFNNLDLFTNNGGAGGDGIFVTNMARQGTVGVGTGRIDTTGDSAISITNSNLGELTFTEVIAANTLGNDGVLLNNVGGDGTFTIDDADVTTQNELTVSGTAGGDAVRLTMIQNGTFTFAGVDIDNTGSGDGIDLDTTDGSITFARVDIDNTGSGRGVNIQNTAATGLITFSDGAGATQDDLTVSGTGGGDGVRIANTTAGSTINFSNIAVDNTAGGIGVNILTPAGSVTFNDMQAGTDNDVMVSMTGGGDGIQVMNAVAGSTTTFGGIDLRNLLGGTGIDLLMNDEDVTTTGNISITQNGSTFATGINIDGGMGDFMISNAMGLTTTINGATNAGINIRNTTGSVAFGVVDITNTMSGDGIAIDGASGGVDFSMGGSITGFANDGIVAINMSGTNNFSNFGVVTNAGAMMGTVGIGPVPVGGNGITYTAAGNGTLTINDNVIDLANNGGNVGIAVNAAAGTTTFANSTMPGNVVQNIGGGTDIMLTDPGGGGAAGGNLQGNIAINGANAVIP